MNQSPYSKCSRCGGKMVHEIFLGLAEEFSGLKCVICGEVIDPIILQNRQLMKDGSMLVIPKEHGFRSRFGNV